MSNTAVSEEKEITIYNLFKNMNLTAAIESDSKALLWLERHEKTFFGYVDGCFLNEEKIVKDVGSKLKHHKICDNFTEKHLCDIYTSIDNNLLFYAAKNSTSGFKTWSSLTNKSRSKILYNIAQTLEKYQSFLAVIEALSTGKHFSRVKAKDIPNLIESFSYYAGCASQLENLSKTWFPTGPVCVIAEEFNNPFLTFSLRLSSVLASGNSILLLTDIKSSLTSLFLAEICSESGLPPGVLNVIPIDQVKITTIGTLPIFSKLCFTAPPDRSVLFSKISSESHIPYDVLIPRRPIVIVYENADLHSAANSVLEVFFSHDTRSQSGGCKVMIQESVSKPFLQILNECFANILIGQNMSKTDMSCIVTETQKKVLTEYIAEAMKLNENALKHNENAEKPNEKAVILNKKISSVCCIKTENCSYLHMMPVLISNLQTNSKLVNQELGGPIIVTVPFRTVKESISMFNCDNKGSPVSIWTEKISVALEVALKLKTGVVWVNSENLTDARIPFNGVYTSGNSTEGGKDALYSHMSVTIYKENISNQISKYNAWISSSKEVQKPTSFTLRKDVKEYKLFIGGSFKHSDNGTTLFNENTLIPSGTEIDVRLAVSSASAAQVIWESYTDSQKRKVFFAIIDKLKKFKEEYVSELQKDYSIKDCQTEVDEAIDLLYYWATQNDKFNGPTEEIKKNLIVMQNRNPLGVIGIQCPDEKPLLSLVFLVISAIVHGNAIVATASTKYPTISLKICKIFSSANVPGGVINVICGNNTRLVPALCINTDVSAIWFTDVPPKVIYTNCNITQRIFYCNEIWTDFNEAKYFKSALECTYGKTVFLPAGEIFAN